MDTVLGFQCDGELRSAMNEFTQLQKFFAGRKEVQKKFHLAKPLETPQEVTDLVWRISSIFADAVQTKNVSSNNQVWLLCSKLTDKRGNSSWTALDRLANIVKSPKIHSLSETGLFNSFNLDAFFNSFGKDSWNSGKFC